MTLALIVLVAIVAFVLFMGLPFLFTAWMIRWLEKKETPSVIVVRPTSDVDTSDDRGTTVP